MPSINYPDYLEKRCTVLQVLGESLTERRELAFAGAARPHWELQREEPILIPILQIKSYQIL
jgi:hypothetical protein